MQKELEMWQAENMKHTESLDHEEKLVNCNNNSNNNAHSVLCCT